MRAILEAAVRPEGRLRLGTTLAEMSRKRTHQRRCRILGTDPRHQARRAAAFRMILLDTNVVSEAMKPEPAPAIRAWLDEQAAETLYRVAVRLLRCGPPTLPNPTCVVGGHAIGPRVRATSLALPTPRPSCHPSLRGALATKQSSRGAPRPLDCFASLAMTVARA